MAHTPARGQLFGATLDEKLEAIEPLLAEGWTQDAALNHIEGDCDVLVCSACTNPEPLYLVCRQCGEAFHLDAARVAYEEHTPGSCGSEQGWDLLPESEAL